MCFASIRLFEVLKGVAVVKLEPIFKVPDVTALTIKLSTAPSVSFSSPWDCKLAKVTVTEPGLP